MANEVVRLNFSGIGGAKHGELLLHGLPVTSGETLFATSSILHFDYFLEVRVLHYDNTTTLIDAEAGLIENTQLSSYIFKNSTWECPGITLLTSDRLQISTCVRGHGQPATKKASIFKSPAALGKTAILPSTWTIQRVITTAFEDYLDEYYGKIYWSNDDSAFGGAYNYVSNVILSDGDDDEEQPSISIPAPQSATVTHPSTISVEVGLFDNIGVTKAAWAFTSTTSPPSADPETTPAGWTIIDPPGATITATKTTVGSEYLHVWATDLAGNTTITYSSGVYSILDNTNPTLVIEPEEREFNITDISVDITLSDNIGVVQAAYCFTLDPIKPSLDDDPLWQSLGISGGTVTQTENGYWYLHVWAKDAAGNTAYETTGTYLKGVGFTSGGLCETKGIAIFEEEQFYVSGYCETNGITVFYYGSLGALTGVVRYDGIPLQGVSVIAINSGSVEVYKTETDINGVYLLQIPDGTYDVLFRYIDEFGTKYGMAVLWKVVEEAV